MQFFQLFPLALICKARKVKLPFHEISGKLLDSFFVIEIGIKGNVCDSYRKCTNLCAVIRLGDEEIRYYKLKYKKKL